MNGALFGAIRVLNNFYYMVECKRTKHGILAQFGMFIYMIYFLTMQILSYFMVGSLYVSIKLFYTNFFQTVTKNNNFAIKHPDLWNFFNGETKPLNFSITFSYVYVVFLIITCLVSIAVPIDKAMTYFKIIAFILSILTITSIFGIAVFLIETGIYTDG